MSYFADGAVGAAIKLVVDQYACAGLVRDPRIDAVGGTTERAVATFSEGTYIRVVVNNDFAS